MKNCLIKTVLICIFLWNPLFNGIAVSQIFFEEDFESYPSDWTCSDGELSQWDAGVGRCESTDGFGDEWKMGSGHNSDNAVYAWKHEDVPNGYRTVSRKWFYGDDLKSEIYHRWYMKIPPSFNKNINEGFKFWRYILRENGYSGPPEIYFSAKHGEGAEFDDGNLVIWTLRTDYLTLIPINAFNDGLWHSHELRIKLNSNNSSDGIIQYWLDGVLKASYSNLSFSSASDMKIHRLGVGIGNASDSLWFMSEWTAAAFDDYAVGTSYIGTLGNEEPPVEEPPVEEPPVEEPPVEEPPVEEPPVDVLAEILFQEDFENVDLQSLGWYDNTSLSFSTIEKIDGIKSVEYHFNTGASKADSGEAIRRQFDSSESVYVSYWIKYSANWQEQEGGYGHHEFYLLTDQDDAWSGLSNTHLTAYIEHHDFVPVMSFQDARNIDQDNIGVDLTDITENRAVGGCNGGSDGYGSGICYDSGGGEWRNGKIFKADRAFIVPGKWHKIEAFFRMNSIVDGKGIADGFLRYWIDGELVIDKPNVMMRTAQHPTQEFNQFIIAPYMGNGAPVDQTFWIDRITVATAPPEVLQNKPLPPADFK